LRLEAGKGFGKKDPIPLKFSECKNLTSVPIRKLEVAETIGNIPIVNRGVPVRKASGEQDQEGGTRHATKNRQRFAIRNLQVARIFGT